MWTTCVRVLECVGSTGKGWGCCGERGGGVERIKLFSDVCVVVECSCVRKVCAVGGRGCVWSKTVSQCVEFCVVCVWLVACVVGVEEW